MKRKIKTKKGLNRLNRLWKKAVISGMAICIALSPVSSFANMNQEMQQSSFQSMAPTGSKVFSKQDALSISKPQIAKSLEMSNMKGSLMIEELIPLSSLENKAMAYLVLFRQNQKNGYAIIGALDDGYANYGTVLDDSFKQVWNEKEKALSSSYRYVQRYFVPPMGIGFQVSNDQKQWMYLHYSSNNGSFQDVTNEIQSNLKQHLSFTNLMRSEKNRKANQAALVASKSLAGSVVTKPLSIVESVRLTQSGVGQFVPLKDGTIGPFYGGNQWWLPAEKSGTACGPTAGANIAYYMAKTTNTTKYSRLFPWTAGSKSTFVTALDQMYTKMEPWYDGVTSTNKFADRFKLYASEKGVTVTSYTIGRFSFDSTLYNFIKNGLRSNVPVASLNLKKINYDYGWHWMTITQYNRNSTGYNELVFSDGTGKVRFLNGDLHLLAVKFPDVYVPYVYDPGFVYFN